MGQAAVPEPQVHVVLLLLEAGQTTRGVLVPQEASAHDNTSIEKSLA
jgi:hypothetical protein